MYAGAVRVWNRFTHAALALTLAACGGESMNALDGAVDASDGVDAQVTALRDAGPRPDRDVSQLLGPPYPVILAHGFFGFDDFAGAGFLTYFYEVPEYLEARGETQVFVTTVDPFNSSEVRGEQLLAHVERILAETGHAKVNLIGHSQGGLDARYVAAVRPDLVASVTAYATPHRGSPLADIIAGIAEDPRLRDLADRLVRLIGAPIWDAAGDETSVALAMDQLTSPGSTEFNQRYPNQPDVAYFSVAGRTDRDDGGEDCRATDSPPFVSRWQRTLDPVDPLLDISEQIVDGGGENVVNDGLVRVFSARWGRFLGCVPADHLDQIGQLFGDGPGFGNDFDYRAFYADLIAFLRDEGH